MSELITYSLPLSFYFETKQPVPIDELVKSLLALEKLAAKVPILLGELSDTAIDLQELKVSKIESGSLKEVLEVTLSFLSEEDKAKFKAWVSDTKMGRATKLAAVGGLAALGVLLVASSAITAYDSFTKSDTPSIQANNNTIINIGADAIGVSADSLKKAVDAAMAGDKKRVVSAALDFVSPASGENGGGIYAGTEKAGVSFSHQAATDAPAQADFRARDVEVAYEKTTVEIRVLDRDRTEGGWKATLPTITGDKRLPLYFADGVPADKAMAEEKISSDVVVTYAQDFNKGVLVPKSILVKKIY
ncbi:hypothetical protein [Pseudomonas sp. NBRC 100443]|uniref:hypothetical protein n=1 Tax=Pseudomonas sp. NBRC 100443 TaxID=1113665 RepID=UPI0024A20AB8|nr:hypothetical protein [Pseudomonas sp. NBRC 100443]GLU41956.1 hypothetical protein Pssp01_60490 [Pseudomonas sp. NBRC 100443]